MPGHSEHLSGIAASPGVALGLIFVLDRRDIRIPRFHVELDQTDYERTRLRDAIDQSIQQLENIRSQFDVDGMDHTAILEAHEMMLRDQALFDEAVQFICNEQINAEWAVDKVISRLKDIFDKMPDAYFRERRGDIDFVGERLLRNLVGHVTDIANIDDLQSGSVVVAHDLSPADTTILSRHRTTAFVTERGGKTSHTSIIARSIGVPAVVGVHGLLDIAGDGDTILVDGFDGIVIVRPTQAEQQRGRRRADAYRRATLDLIEVRALPAKTLDGAHIDVMGNIEAANEVASVLDHGGEGIGLYRTEFMYVGRQTPPVEEEHYRTYCKIFDEAGDRPVSVRTLDLGGDKLPMGDHTSYEPNPALGLRGMRFCFANRSLFEPQIAGLLRAGTRGDLRIILPMISGVDELRDAQSLIRETQARLQREGTEHRADVPIGIMIEVPSAAMVADLLAQECDFFSIGTNDLMQYLLAIDRTNDRVAYLYTPLHPAVLRTLERVRSAADAAGIDVSICGEMAGDLEHVPILLALGFRRLSMNSSSIGHVKRLIREVALTDCGALFEVAKRCTTHTEVSKLVREFIASTVPTALGNWGD